MGASFNPKTLTVNEDTDVVMDELQGESRIKFLEGDYNSIRYHRSRWAYIAYIETHPHNGDKMVKLGVRYD